MLIFASLFCMIHLQLDASEKLKGVLIIKGEEPAYLLTLVEFPKVEYHSQPMSVLIRDLSASLANKEWVTSRPKLTVGPDVDVSRTFDYQGEKVSLGVLLAAVARQLRLVIIFDETGIRIANEIP